MGDIALNSRINSIKSFTLGKVGNSPYKTTSHESKFLPAVCWVLVKYLLIQEYGFILLEPRKSLSISYVSKRIL